MIAVQLHLLHCCFQPRLGSYPPHAKIHAGQDHHHCEGDGQHASETIRSFRHSVFSFLAGIDTRPVRFLYLVSACIKKRAVCQITSDLTAARFCCFARVLPRKESTAFLRCCELAFHLCMSPDSALSTFSYLPKGYDLLRLICRVLSGFMKMSCTLHNIPT